MPRVVEDERFQPEQVLAVDVTIEIDAKAWLVIVPGAVAANADAGIAELHTLPLEIDWVVRAFLVMRVEVLPVSRVDVKRDIVQRATVEKRVHTRHHAHRLRRQTQHRSAEENNEHEWERSDSRPGHHLSLQPELDAECPAPHRT